MIPQICHCAYAFPKPDLKLDINFDEITSFKTKQHSILLHIITSPLFLISE
ncbi:hypothetical protein WN51_07753 [Melipona quadrifasciata]|uniref:Uncharacterized protein n=1 Tax=Melipona quadrifasciata TaxID=166423 RepID=A0A0M9A6Q1_9HYME|nr:hypothetical protein WN51_07753 [Melipona quadrifasciata]